MQHREAREHDSGGPVPRRQPVAARAPEQQGERREPAEARERDCEAGRTVDRDDRQGPERRPPAQMVGAGKTPDGEERQRNGGHRIAARGVDERARSAAEDDLHRGTKDEGRAHHRDPDRRMRALELAAIGREQRQRRAGDEPDREKLRQQPGGVPLEDHAAPRPGKAEAKSFQREPEAEPDGQQRPRARPGGERHREHRPREERERRGARHRAGARMRRGGGGGLRHGGGQYRPKILLIMFCTSPGTLAISRPALDQPTTDSG